MKRLGLIGLACLLSACQSSPEHHLSGQPDKAANFPAMAATLSDCVYRFAQSLTSPYLFHRIHARADKEILVTAKGSNAPTQPTYPGLELRFISQGQTTTVELRDTANGDHELEDAVWSIVERCAQQGAQVPATKSTPP
jgi:hypothetical protein